MVEDMEYEASMKKLEELIDNEYQEYEDCLKRAFPAYEIDKRYQKSLRGREVEGLLGAGGFGYVYACRDKSCFNEARAVKIIKSKELYPIRAIEKEFKLQYDFQDVSVRLYSNFAVGKFFCASMEMMTGTLKDLLKNNQCFDAVDTVRIMKEISVLVARLHNNNDPEVNGGKRVTHGDIKPENIFYKVKNRKTIFRLGDFGCAKNTDATVSRLAGTDKYCYNLKETSPARDIYALGLVMMELQGAEVPADGRRDEPETMWEDMGALVDTDLRAISRKACSVFPKDRYTINGFIKALDTWLMEHQDEVSMKDDTAEMLLKKAEAFEFGAVGVTVQMERAKKYYEAAARKHSKEYSGKAAYRLYKIFDRDEETYSKEKVMEQLESSMNLDYIPAMNEYACRRLKELGPDGDLRELMKMAKLLKKASNTLPAAAYNLALLMKVGIIAEETEGQTKQLLKSAADRKYEMAVRLYSALYCDK